MRDNPSVPRRDRQTDRGCFNTIAATQQALARVENDAWQLRALVKRGKWLGHPLRSMNHIEIVSARAPAELPINEL
jgi:hypothetical protein